MPLHPGTQELLISETVSNAGSTTREGSTQSDSILVSLFVNSVDSGSVVVTVYTLTDVGKEVEIISFPAVSSATDNILLRKAAISLQRFKVVATYTGGCSYEVYVRAIEGAGESSARILGSSNWKVSQVTIGTSAVALIPSSLDDRSSILVKNWSSTANIFIADTLLKADASTGYPLAPRDALALDIAAGATVYAVSDIPGADIRVVEGGG